MPLPLPAAAALLPVLELDATAAGQLMLSRPLVMGPLLGLALDRGALGLAMGAVLEGLLAQDLPVGSHMPLNATVALGVALLAACLPVPLAPAAALPLGLLAGDLHARGEAWLRQGRRGVCRSAEERLSGSGSVSWARLIMPTLASQAAWTASVAALALLGLAPAAGWAWAHAPECVRAGLEFGWRVAPWLAMAGLFKALGRVA